MSMEMGDSRGIWKIKCIRLWMNQSCYSQGVYLSKFSLETLHFMGIRVFIVGYVKECEKSFFCNKGHFGESLQLFESRNKLHIAFTILGIIQYLPSSKNTLNTLNGCGQCLSTNLLLIGYNNGRGKEKRLQRFLF